MNALEVMLALNVIVMIIGVGLLAQALVKKYQHFVNK